MGGDSASGNLHIVAIAMVHSDNRLACAIAMIFATGIALSLLLIGAYSRPFTGEISVRPDLLKPSHYKRNSSHTSVALLALGNAKAGADPSWQQHGGAGNGSPSECVSFGVSSSASFWAIREFVWA